MFNNLSDKLDKAFHVLKGHGSITEVNVAETLKEVRRALLDADVNFKIAKDFTKRVKEKAMGQNVLTTLNPGQLMVKIVKDELTELMGGESVGVNLGRLFRAAHKASVTFKVPVTLIIAIARVESSYRLGAVNPKSKDYGIMQINEYHVKRGNLNRDKLLGDLEYSFYHGVRVFSWFYKTYPLEEAIMRYNCGTRKGCTGLASVKDYLSKVQGAM